MFKLWKQIFEKRRNRIERRDASLLHNAYYSKLKMWGWQGKKWEGEEGKLRILEKQEELTLKKELGIIGDFKIVEKEYKKLPRGVGKKHILPYFKQLIELGEKFPNNFVKFLTYKENPLRFYSKFEESNIPAELREKDPNTQIDLILSDFYKTITKETPKLFNIKKKNRIKNSKEKFDFNIKNYEFHPTLKKIIKNEFPGLKVAKKSILEYNYLISKKELYSSTMQQRMIWAEIFNKVLRNIVGEIELEAISEHILKSNFEIEHPEINFRLIYVSPKERLKYPEIIHKGKKIRLGLDKTQQFRIVFFEYAPKFFFKN